MKILFNGKPAARWWRKSYPAIISNVRQTEMKDNNDGHFWYFINLFHSCIPIEILVNGQLDIQLSGEREFPTGWTLENETYISWLRFRIRTLQKRQNNDFWRSFFTQNIWFSISFFMGHPVNNYFLYLTN